MRKLIGYRRLEGIAAAQALARLYAASRLFVNFFRPSFKLAEKTRNGARVNKRYLPPQTPCERLLLNENMDPKMIAKLRRVAESLDPLYLLEEVRTMQRHLVEIPESGPPSPIAIAKPRSHELPSEPINGLARRRNPTDSLPETSASALLSHAA